MAAFFYLSRNPVLPKLPGFLVFAKKPGFLVFAKKPDFLVLILIFLLGIVGLGVCWGPIVS
jgi:hypothetical protein